MSKGDTVITESAMGETGTKLMRGGMSKHLVVSILGEYLEYPNIVLGVIWMNLFGALYLFWHWEWLQGNTG